MGGVRLLYFLQVILDVCLLALRLSYRRRKTCRKGGVVGWDCGGGGGGGGGGVNPEDGGGHRVCCFFIHYNNLVVGVVVAAAAAAAVFCSSANALCS